MQLLYSGAETDGAVQSDPLKSLGGYISSSLIPNGGLSNIFPPISRRILKEGLSDIRLIVIKNETGSALTSVRIWTEKGTLTNYKLAAVVPATDSCGKSIFETLSNGNTIPYQASLAPAEAEVNAIAIGTLAAGVSIGLWIQRDVDVAQFNELDGVSGVEELTCTELSALLEAQDLNTKVYDESRVIIDWV